MTTITGTTANDIAESVRRSIDRELLRADEPLPSVRALAARLGVNRNTVVAAYRQLAQAGIVVSRGRSGTRVAGTRSIAQEGYAAATALRDVGTGNPDPTLIPDPTRALARVVGRPVLYGEPVIDADLQAWAGDWMRAALGPARAMQLTVTGGATDAIERLLAAALTRDDAVGLEDPCFLSSINTVRQGGYRPVAIPVDAEGMTVAGLRAAIDAGVRAVVCTPRAQNPTGASLTPQRAAKLRAVLAEHPYLLVIEDDHYSMLSASTYVSVIPGGNHRFALIRSVSKFLGPDMCLAVTASDPDTAERLARRLSPGTTWVSHLLQRLAVGLLSDRHVAEQIARAGTHYAGRNARFAALLGDHGLSVVPGDGLNLWVPVPADARAVGVDLMRRGWLARTGDEFTLSDAGAAHLRLTVHDLTDAEAERLASDLVASVEAALTQKAG